MKPTLQILIVEDSEDDALLVLHQINKGGYDIDYERVETSDTMKSMLKEKTWDIVLSDYQMPHFNGLEALKILKETAIDIPFIIISGTIGEETAVEAMREGAHDYIMKDNMQRLLPAVERELRETQSRAERKLFEQKKKEAEEKLKVLSHAIEQNPAMIIITDTEGNIEYINPKFEEITGYTLPEVMGKKPNIIKSGKMPDTLYQDMWDTIKSGNVWHGELVNKKKNDEFFWAKLSTSPIIAKDGNITHFVGIQEDITKRKKMEEELILAKEHAEESDRLKTAFLQNMSHEIRTPMNAIIGFSSLMVSKYNDKEKLEEFSQIINNSCKNLLEIIDGILDIAKIESGRMLISNNAGDLQNFFNTLALFFNEYKLRKEKQHIKLDLQCQYDLEAINIETDFVKLKQVFINLISNALKFTESGEITGGCKFDKNQNLIFFVSDTGIGIPHDKHDIIFKRFVKLDQDKSKLLEGSGLGLAIVKELLDLMGGKIWFESEPFKGTTFYFTFPYEIIRK